MTDKNLFSIQYASNLSGVGLHTIRAWERRYSAVDPMRSDNGRRSYTHDQIEKLKLLKLLTNKGTSISQVASLSIDELKEILDFSAESTHSNANVTSVEIDFDQCLDRLKAAVSFKKLDILTYELEKISSEVSTRDLCIRVIVPFLRYIGNRYESGELSIAEEHAISSVFKFHIGSYLYSKPANVTSSKTIAFATPIGELHEFGIILGALLAKHYGIKFYYLGINLPCESLLKAAKDLEVDTIVLGVTNPVLDKNVLGEYIEKHFERLSNVDLWVGGRAGVVKESFFNPKLDFLETFEKLDKKMSTL